MKEKILVNDIIVIDKHNTGYNYYTYFEFFDIYNLDSELKENFGESLVDHVNRHHNEEDYMCLFKAPDPNNSPITLYVIQGLESKKIFLINEKAIFNYYHTTNAYDNTNIILDKLITYNKELREELFRQKIDISNLKLRVESLSKENSTLKNKSKSEPMPPPETGMFGIVRRINEGIFVPFCVVNDFIVYAEKSWDNVKTFDIYGKSGYSEIIRLYKGVKSFNRAEALFNNEDIVRNTEQLIWKSEEN